MYSDKAVFFLIINIGMVVMSKCLCPLLSMDTIYRIHKVGIFMYTNNIMKMCPTTYVH